MNLRSIDLNLVPILRALLDERSVTRAARRLGMSQPAASNALNRLRDRLEDPLLVRIGRTMQLTPRAERLRATVGLACASIETLFHDEGFDPASSRRQFVVATPDYLALLLGPSLLRTVVETAPSVTIRVVGSGPDLLPRVRSGEVDIAVLARTGLLDEGLNIHAGFRDTIVGVVARSHPFASQPPASLMELEAWPWIGADVWQTMFTPGDSLWPLIELAPKQVVLSLPYLLLLPMIAAQTTGVTFVPKALADQVAKIASIALFDPPGSPVGIDLCQIWSPLLDADSGHRWFRGVLESALATHFPRL